MTPLYRCALVAFLCVLLWPSFASAQRNIAVIRAAENANEQRVALVIGNSAYKESPLRNPVNDATDIAQALKGLGFNVVLRANANRRQMIEAVRQFGNQIKRGGVGFFFYAGHGVQSRGKNFLIPVGAQLDSESDLEFETVDASMVLAQMDEAGNRVNIMVLDACRDNPFSRSFRSASRGLAQMDAAKGSFLAYATSPGSTASDGDGRNGIYTKHLLSSLKQSDTKLEEVFKRVRLEVARETGNKQIPWDSSSVLGDFHFTPPVVEMEVAPVVPAPAPTPPIQTVGPAPSATTIELSFWESIKSSTSPDDYEAYIEKYPDGNFVALAKSRLRRLQHATQAPAPAVNPSSSPASVSTSVPSPPPAITPTPPLLPTASVSAPAGVQPTPSTPPKPLKPLGVVLAAPGQTQPSATAAALEDLAAKQPRAGEEWEYLARQNVFGNTVNLTERIKAVVPGNGIEVEHIVGRKTVNEWMLDGKAALLAAPVETGGIFSSFWDGGRLDLVATSNWTGCGKSNSCIATGRVTGREKITVPAGTFDTQRLELDVRRENSRGEGFPGKITIWYSDVLKRVIKQLAKTYPVSTTGSGSSAGSELPFIFDETIELIAYRPPK